LHRVGRSGRYGKKGVAINLVTMKDAYLLKEIEDWLKIEIKNMPDTDIIEKYLKE
jgi:superfamily II DNA/RNA helicase